MKYSQSWLNEWVNSGLTQDELCRRLTLSGFEVEELVPAAKNFSGVLVGEIIATDKHPQADRLTVCLVNIGQSTPLNIVCGASNARTGIKVPVAMINAVLPDMSTIKLSNIRGTTSHGMLCSAKELGFLDENQGLLELPQDAPLGADLREYLHLNDYIIDVSITPNRGDCLSIRGLAREISALSRSPLLKQEKITVKPTIKQTLPICVKDASACPRYLGRLVRQVKADVPTPIWMKERLRRSGIRSIHVVVDIINYVMLELGQPMHAFDFASIKQGITVRRALQGEKISLLDGTDKSLDASTLVIADQERPLAIAGIMGGLDSSVTLTSADIFIESAYFSPKEIAQERQRSGLQSDSAYRFERGVDPTIQREAMERATQLILEIAGGEADEIIEVCSETDLPHSANIPLTSDHIQQVLGFSIPEQDVESIFEALQFKWQKNKTHWLVEPPSYRFDLSIKEDIIEEIARLNGYDNIPTHAITANLTHSLANKNKIENHLENSSSLQTVRQLLCDQGYHEIISYSFVEKKLQALVDPDHSPIELLNPMTAEMAVMRTSLWPGLLNSLIYNLSRQQQRVRLFEIGACFMAHDNKCTQQPMLGGLITGPAFQEQWGIPLREVDFYDLKGNVEIIINLFCNKKNIRFTPDSHPALHPGQTAAIYHQDQKLGTLGALHPSILQSLGLAASVYLFELSLNLLNTKPHFSYHEVSKFPEIRRDIAILVNQTVPSKEIQDTIRLTIGDWLKDIFIFDVYQGKGISPGLKSVALALILQHPSRTLVDDEVVSLMEQVMTALKGQLGAVLRS